MTTTVRERIQNTLAKLTTKRTAEREKQTKAEFDADAMKVVDYVLLVNDLHDGKEVAPERIQVVLDAAGIGPGDELLRDVAAFERRTDARRTWARESRRPSPTNAEIQAVIDLYKQKKIVDHPKELRDLENRRTKMQNQQADSGSCSRVYYNDMQREVPGIVLRLRATIAADLARMQAHTAASKRQSWESDPEADALRATKERNERILEAVELALNKLDARPLPPEPKQDDDLPTID